MIKEILNKSRFCLIEFEKIIKIMNKTPTQHIQYRKSCKAYCFVTQGLTLDSFVATWRCQGLGSTNIHCVITQKKDGLHNTVVDA
jgi:hypothetical protein